MNITKRTLLVGLIALSALLFPSLVNAAPAPDMGIEYKSHIENLAWEKAYISEGNTSGTFNKGLRLEAMNLRLTNPIPGVKLMARTHVQNIGWSAWTEVKGSVGSEGKGLRLESLQLKLEGPGSESYDIIYRAHVQNIGWQSWVQNGQIAGTEGKGLRLEATQIKIVNGFNKPVTNNELRYNASTEGNGWHGDVIGGQTAGTVGQGKKLDAFKIRFNHPNPNYKVKYSAHVQNIGWMNPVENGQVAGIPGSSNRLEAVKIWFENVPAQYRVQYRVHVEGLGWQEWVENGEIAGTAGLSLRVEAIEVKVSTSALPVKHSYSFVNTGNVTWNKFVQDQAAKGVSPSVVNTYANPIGLIDQPRRQQFIRIDRFNNIADIAKVNNFLASRDGVLKGQAQTFVNVAKKYNIDPLYLAAHAVHETGFGTSKLSTGVDYSLKGGPVKRVYNVYGIGAYDLDPINGGAALAYQNGWTTVESAIEGGAKWISENYIHNATYKQNTAYKMRWNTIVSWHQYATDPNWANAISRHMNAMSGSYANGSIVNYEVANYGALPK